jgi:hypothetical protein
LVPSWLVFPATKTQSNVLGHGSAPHLVGLSLVRSSNLREKSARQIALAGCVTARSASERRPAFDFRYRLEISLAGSPRLRFTRLNTGTRMRSVQHNGTATFLAWSAKNFGIPEIAPLAALWDAPWCCSGLLCGNDFARDTLTHLGSSRSADVGAEMLARGLANKEIAGAARTYLSWSKSPTRRNPTN